MKYYCTLFSCLCLFFLAACNDDVKQSIQSSAEQSMDTMPGNCPYLTKDHKGNVVMSWVRSNRDSGAVFCYAVMGDGATTFSGPVIIPESENIQPHGENLPKIIFKPSGEIIALWGAANPSPANKYSGMVFYSQSFDEGRSWTAAVPLVSDTAGNDQRYYDVALLGNGEVGIIWLDNRSKTGKDGSSLFYAVTEGRNVFKRSA